MAGNHWKPLETSGNPWRSGGLGAPLGSFFFQNTPFSPGFIRFLALAGDLLSFQVFPRFFSIPLLKRGAPGISLYFTGNSWKSLEIWRPWPPSPPTHQETTGNLWKSLEIWRAGGPPGKRFFQNTPFSQGFIRFLQRFTVFRNVL